MIDAPHSDPVLLGNQFFLDSLEVDFVDLLFDEIAAGRCSGSEPEARVKNRALRKALEVIGDREGLPLTVAELERSSGASSRTLRYAFRERFGLSPKQYLLAVQLNHVRRKLLQARPGRGKVSDIANEHGFWHMGDFASHYRRLFGELPGETLEKTR